MAHDPYLANMPEHAKAETVKAETQAIGEFLDWLIHEKEFDLVDADGNTVLSGGTDRAIQGLIAEHFDINYQEYMAEKDRLLEHVRSLAT